MGMRTRRTPFYPGIRTDQKNCDGGASAKDIPAPSLSRTGSIPRPNLCVANSLCASIYATEAQSGKRDTISPGTPKGNSRGLTRPRPTGWFHLLRRMFWISGLPGREQRKSHLDTESSGGREHTNAGVRLRLYATRLREQSILPAGGDACAAVALRTGETVPEPGAQEPRRPRLVRPSTSKGRLRSSSFSKISRWVFAQAMMRRFGAFQSPRV